MTNIADIKPSERTIEIVHPSTNEELGIRISVLSINDERLQKLKKRFMDERLRLEAKGKGFRADDVEDNRDALALAAITGWDWYGETVNFNNTKPTFSPVKVKEVFKELPWFRDQVEEAISDEKAFFTTSK